MVCCKWNPCESRLWIADEAAAEEILFPAGDTADSTAWTGILNYMYNGHPHLLLEVGVWDGSEFTPGPAVYLEGVTGYWHHNYTTSAEPLTIPEGQHLALRITLDEETSAFEFFMGGSWAMLSAPAGAQYPGSGGSSGVSSRCWLGSREWLYHTILGSSTRRESISCVSRRQCLRPLHPAGHGWSFPAM